MDSNSEVSVNIPEVVVSSDTRKMLDQLNFVFVIRDFSARLIYGNPAYVDFLGLKSTKEIIDKYDCEIGARLYEDVDVLNEFDRQYKTVCKTKDPFSTLELHAEAVDYPYIFRKFPYYNSNGECVGMFGYNEKLVVYTLNDYVKGNMPGSMLLNKPDDFFTERQCEIMFYRLQGLKVKDVAMRLNLSENTVNNYMQTLYDKAGASSITDFKEFCEKRNYHRYLPKRFLTSEEITFGSSII